MKVRLLIFFAVVSLLLVITPAVSQVIESKWTGTQNSVPISGSTLPLEGSVA